MANIFFWGRSRLHGLWSRQLVVLRLLWLIFGITNAFLGPALSLFYVDELKASPKTQALMAVITGIAWNLRMLPAYMSDSFPLFGYHRKPYLHLGLILYSTAYTALALLPASIGLTAILLFAATFGEMTSAVIIDSILVEEMKLESKADKGTLQTHCQILLAIGGVSGTLLGGHASEYWLSYKQMFLVNAAAKVPGFLFACILEDSRERTSRAQSVGSLEEVENSDSGPALNRMGEIWEAAKKRGLWQPGIFVFLFGTFPQTTAVMPSFYIKVLKFNAAKLSYLQVVGGLGGSIGMFSYNHCCKTCDWRIFFVVTILLASALSLTQLILVFRLNQEWGMPDLLFAMGDDVIVDMSSTLLGFPLLILVASMARQGVEGSTYALVTSIQDAGGTVSASISAYIISALGITLDDFSNLWKLVLICSTVKLGALPLIPLLPAVKLVDNKRYSRIETYEENFISKEYKGFSDKEKCSWYDGKGDGMENNVDAAASHDGESELGQFYESENRAEIQGAGDQHIPALSHEVKPSIDHRVDSDDKQELTGVATVPSTQSTKTNLLDESSCWGGSALFILLVTGVCWSIGTAIKDVLVAK